MYPVSEAFLRAVQAERTASASRSIVVPIPAAGTDAGAETGGNGDSAGTGEIETGGCIASISGQGMAAAAA